MGQNHTIIFLSRILQNYQIIRFLTSSPFPESLSFVYDPFCAKDSINQGVKIVYEVVTATAQTHTQLKIRDAQLRKCSRKCPPLSTTRTTGS